MAFTKRARYAIGIRDHWTCQGLDGVCHTAYMTLEGFAKFDDGFMVCAAHYPELHRDGDKNPNNGRILCTVCHALEELERDNVYGARMLLKMGVFTWKHAKSTGHQWHPKLEQIAKLSSRRVLAVGG